MVQGQAVKLLVSEPWDWAAGYLQGDVIDCPSDGIRLIQLLKPIKGKKFISDLLKVRPRYAGDSFASLTAENSITIGGALIKEGSDELDYLLIGSLTRI